MNWGKQECILGINTEEAQTEDGCQIYLTHVVGFPGGPMGKEFTCNAGFLGSNPWLGRSLGEGNGNPLQYSCMENSIVRGAW